VTWQLTPLSLRGSIIEQGWNTRDEKCYLSVLDATDYVPWRGSTLPSLLNDNCEYPAL